MKRGTSERSARKELQVCLYPFSSTFLCYARVLDAGNQRSRFTRPANISDSSRPVELGPWCRDNAASGIASVTKTSSNDASFRH